MAANTGSLLDAMMASPAVGSRSCPVAHGVGALFGARHACLQVPRSLVAIDSSGARLPRPGSCWRLVASQTPWSRVTLRRYGMGGG